MMEQRQRIALMTEQTDYIVNDLDEQLKAFEKEGADEVK